MTHREYWLGPQSGYQIFIKVVDMIDKHTLGQRVAYRWNVYTTDKVHLIAYGYAKSVDEAHATSRSAAEHAAEYVIKVEKQLALEDGFRQVGMPWLEDGK